MLLFGQRGCQHSEKPRPSASKRLLTAEKDVQAQYNMMLASSGVPSTIPSGDDLGGQGVERGRTISSRAARREQVQRRRRLLAATFIAWSGVKVPFWSGSSTPGPHTNHRVGGKFSGRLDKLAAIPRANRFRSRTAACLASAMS